MPVRKTRRVRRPAIESAEEYQRAWLNAKYFESGGKYLERAEFHADRFDEDELRSLYERDRAAFAATAKPGTRHPLWWKFDSREARVENWPEVAQLHAMRLLTADEIEALRQEAVAEDEKLHLYPLHNGGLPFRRSAIFWMFLATKPRDLDIYESAQLARMGVLTYVEKQIIDSPENATGARRPLILPHRTKFYYMPAGERELLGLTYGHDEETEQLLCTPATTGGENSDPWNGE